jgi:N-acetylglucosamine-6-phosphate deacetylase
VNESSQSITAEVRIGDFIDSYDINLYRQLAGGVTSANILHGSANTIGGQNQVIKFRWGALPEDVKFDGAPAGIKFALGENVKQSNMSGTSRSRYPQSRMGVEQLLRDAFLSAREYRDRPNRWKKQQASKQFDELPPRRDLELDALVEVLEGKRLVHCHSYRQDEILATLRVCEEFGVRIATFQHILEGYKVADHMARHGVGGSSFSDWWAYKYEVYDAIPYNGTILRDAGVTVSFNSDDAELARRLNLEAAKAVKYGGVPEHDALKFVTLNPAKQLGIDKWVGSLEVGKVADLVVWNGPPLSTYSRCEQTWIDGRKYFDRADDAERRKQVAERRAALVQRILASGESFADADDDKKDEWPRKDIFCNCQDDRYYGGDH